MFGHGVVVGVIKLICRLRFRGVIVGVGPTNIIRSRILFGCVSVR